MRHFLQAAGWFTALLGFFALSNKMHHRIKTHSLSSYPSDSRLDHIVAECLQLTRSQARGLFDFDGVRVDGRFCGDAGQRRGESQSLELRYIPGKKYEPVGFGWQNRPFHILFEDNSILVVEKKAGVLTVPSDKGERHTLIHSLQDYLKRTSKYQVTLVAVHRLDRETSGLLVFAKGQAVADNLIAQFKEQKPHRLYAVIAAGHLTKDQGTFESRFITDAFLNQHSSRTGDKGLLAITDFTVLERLKDTSLVQAKLRTGRRNQIRVHLSEAGHPVIGDQRYRSQQAKHPQWPHRRLALHAQTLGFTHPMSGEPLSFESPIPLEMELFLRGSRTNA